MSTRDADTAAVSVRVPDDLPVLTPLACRILLGILVDLTKVEVLDEQSGGGGDDR